VVAKQIATIDYLTNGRLILGTAVGWMEEEFQNLNVPFRNRGKRFEEAINLIRTLYANESPKFQGRYHKFADATFKPRSEDDPTIWFGGNSEIALRRAAKLADGWHPVGLAVDAYSSAARKLKIMLPSGKQFTLSLRILVDLEGKAKPYAGSGGDPRDVISGNRDHAIEMIQKYRDAGLEHLVCYFGDVELASLKRKMNQFAKELIPSFKK
jgi:hypothetical protein